MMSRHSFLIEGVIHFVSYRIEPSYKRREFIILFTMHCFPLRFLLTLMIFYDLSSYRTLACDARPEKEPSREPVSLS